MAVWEKRVKDSPLLDAFTKRYLERYHAKELKELKEQLDTYQYLLESDYGTGTKEHRYGDYAENKMRDLYHRLGNTVLASLRDYDRAIRQVDEPKEPKAAAAEPAVHEDSATRREGQALPEIREEDSQRAFGYTQTKEPDFGSSQAHQPNQAGRAIGASTDGEPGAPAYAAAARSSVLGGGTAIFPRPPCASAATRHGTAPCTA